MGRHADLAQATLKTEMELHRSYAAEFGHNPGGAGARGQGAHVPGLHGLPDSNGGAWELCGADGGPAPVHVGLLRDRPAPGRTGDAAGGALRQVGAHVHGPDFAELVDWCRQATDAAAQGLPRGERERVETAFLISSRYEYLFWDMAWKQGAVAGVAGGAHRPSSVRRKGHSLMRARTAGLGDCKRHAARDKVLSKVLLGMGRREIRELVLVSRAGSPPQSQRGPGYASSITRNARDDRS